jgi:glutamate racemase
MSRKKSIGIFDTGLGGLNIMKEIVKKLPEYDYIYLADNARLPYGMRSKEIVYKFTKEAIDFLFRKRCDLVILACNTVSSEALRKIQREYLPKKYPNKKVLGVIVPAAEESAKKCQNNRMGVIGTQRTIKSSAFVRELSKVNPKIKVFQEACPLLAPIIEAGEHDSETTEMVLKKYLKPLIDKKISILVLGCTHYEILEQTIERIVGPKIKIISESKIVAKRLKIYLERHPEIEKKLAKKHKRIFYSTDLTRNFEVLGSQFFGQKIKPQKAILK